MATNPFAQAPKNPANPFAKAPNFQTLTGQNTYVPPPTNYTLPSLAASTVKAKDPAQNVVKPAPTLPASQVAPKSATPLTTVNPTAPVNSLSNPYNPNANYTAGVQQTGPAAQPQTGLYGQLINQMSETSRENPATTGPAMHNYQQAVQNVNALQDSYASEIGRIESLPIGVGDQTGREQVAQRLYSTKLANAQSAAQQAQQAIPYQIQGTQTQLSGLNQAAGYAQPQLGQYGQGYYNPLDPNGGAAGAGGAALNPINNVQSIAQQVINGQLSPQQAYSMGGTVANWQGLLNQAIQQQNPNFNVAQAQGSFDARQSNTTTAGTAATNAYANAYGQNYPAYLQTQAQLSNVDQLGSLLLQTAQGGQINPFAPQLANQTIGQLRSQLSNADQARFNSTLAAFQGVASQLLANSSGQIPTDVSHNISAISNGSLSLGALKAMVDQARQEGNIKLTNAGGLVNTPGGHIGAPQVGTPNNSGGSGGDYQSYLQAIGAH